MRMKGLTAKITKPITLGTQMECADNTGAKVVELIAVRGYHGRLRRLPRAGVGDVVICAVKRGKETMRHQKVHAVIVRQKKEYRRKDGMRVRFSDNACVVVNPKTFEPQGTEIRTVIAKEVVERFTVIGKIASMVM